MEISPMIQEMTAESKKARLKYKSVVSVVKLNGYTMTDIEGFFCCDKVIPGDRPPSDIEQENSYCWSTNESKKAAIFFWRHNFFSRHSYVEWFFNLSIFKANRWAISSRRRWTTDLVLLRLYRILCLWLCSGWCSALVVIEEAFLRNTLCSYPECFCLMDSSMRLTPFVYK